MSSKVPEKGSLPKSQAPLKKPEPVKETPKAPPAPANLPAVSHSNDPVNVGVPKNKAGQPVKEEKKKAEGPERSWE